MVAWYRPSALYDLNILKPVHLWQALFVLYFIRKSGVPVTIEWEIVHKMDLSVDGFETIVAHSIGNGQVLRLKCKVIPTDLRECGVGHGNEWRFAFYQ